MTRLNIEIKDSSIADKILWMLQHFKNDGVSVKKIDSDSIDVMDSIKSSLIELQQVKNGTTKPQLARDFLNEL
ncbi:MAG: hypothetical protein WC141_00710 [Arcobacteraceae bacterium]